jgi:hypothetical protein
MPASIAIASVPGGQAGARSGGRSVGGRALEPGRTLLGNVHEAVGNGLELTDEGLELTDERLDAVLELTNEGLNTLEHLGAHGHGTVEDLAGLRLDEPPGLAPLGFDSGLRLAPADLRLLERDDAETDGDVGGILKRLTDVHRGLPVRGPERALPGGGCLPL